MFPIEEEIDENEEVVNEVEREDPEEEKISLTDKIKSILTRMFEIEDQKIS